MNRDIKRLALEFNSVAPPPPAPRDNTVYQDKQLDDPFCPAAGESSLPLSLLPAWVNALPCNGEWISALLKSELFHTINDKLAALKDLPNPPPDSVISQIRVAMINSLRQSRRPGEYFGYRIFDPFHPLEEMDSAATKSWIDAENEYTQKFVSTPARDQAAADLAAAWHDRKPEPFSEGADHSLCMRWKYYDSWKHPEDKTVAKKFYRTNERPFAQTNDRVFAHHHQKFKSSIVSFPTDDPNASVHLLNEPPDAQMRGAFVHGDRLYVSFYRHCADELSVFDLNGRHIADAPLPPCKLRATTIDEQTGKLRLRLATFVRPECDYIYDPETNTLAAEDPSPAPLGDCIVEQIWAQSRDGTAVPMWVVRRSDTALDGTAALKMFAYGAAGISVDPQYSESINRWVRQGGIFVVANIRGGNEFGPQWADDGMKMNRQHVIDDLNACARRLWWRHYSIPERTVIMGGSNGGWLVLETVVQNTQQFGAAIARVPVADLNRMSYGSGTFPSRYSEQKEFAERMRLSPYHNVKPDTVYTPTMITTGDKDTVAHTWHALKMAAALQAASPENLCLLRVRHGTGHKIDLFPNDELAAEEADIHAFIERCIGPVDQNAYKATLEPSVENEVNDHGAEIAEEQHRRPLEVRLESVFLPRDPH